MLTLNAKIAFVFVHNSIIQWQRSCIAVVLNVPQLVYVVVWQPVFFSTFHHHIQIVR